MISHTRTHNTQCDTHAHTQVNAAAAAAPSLLAVTKAPTADRSDFQGVFFLSYFRTLLCTWQTWVVVLLLHCSILKTLSKQTHTNAQTHKHTHVSTHAHTQPLEQSLHTHPFKWIPLSLSKYTTHAHTHTASRAVTARTPIKVDPSITLKYARTDTIQHTRTHTLTHITHINTHSLWSCDCTHSH